MARTGTYFAFFLSLNSFPYAARGIPDHSMMLLRTGIFANGGYRAKPYTGCPLNLRVTHGCMSNDLRCDAKLAPRHGKTNFHDS